MFKAILFDLGNVLIPFSFLRAYRRMEELSGLPAAEVRARLAATDLFSRFETGLIRSDDFARLVQKEINFHCEYSQFRDIWNSIFLPEPLLPDALLKGLREKYRLVLVSNTNAMHFEMLRGTYPILRHFDAHVLSYEIHAMKPAPEYYASAVLVAGAAPGECLFIDDLGENVEGARRAGMDAVRFESRDQLEAELLSRGIAWS